MKYILFFLTMLFSFSAFGYVGTITSRSWVECTFPDRTSVSAQSEDKSFGSDAQWQGNIAWIEEKLSSRLYRYYSPAIREQYRLTKGEEFQGRDEDVLCEGKTERRYMPGGIR